MIGRYYPAVNDPSSAWKNHINTQISIDEISSSLKKQNKQNSIQAEELNDTIRQAKQEYISAIYDMSDEISSSINYCASKICNSLDNGFDLLNDNIKELGRSLDFRLSLIQEQMVINNLISENIALLLRIPDIQKERQYYLEQGLKHLKNAILEKDFYENALENLLEAEIREKTDYVALHHIGMIYLYSGKYLDLEKAESYFRRAAKFAKIESDPQSVKLANILAGSILKKLSANFPDEQKMKYVAAESYLQAAISCYIQKKYNDATELAQLAFDLAPEMLEAGLFGCLSSALEGKNDLSINFLKSIVEKNPTYAIIAATDPVLAPKEYIKDWLNQLRHETINQGLSRIKEIRINILKNSIFTLDINDAEEELINSSYIEALKIIEYIDKVVSFDKEKTFLKINNESIDIIKGVCEGNNGIYESLNKYKPIIQDLKKIDLEIIEKYRIEINGDNICDQQNMMFKISHFVRDNCKPIIQHNSFTLKKNIQELTNLLNSSENRRRRKTEDILLMRDRIIIIMMLLAFILGARSCYRLAETPGYGGSLLTPIYFFLYYFIGAAIFSLVFYLIIQNFLDAKNTSSHTELEIKDKINNIYEHIKVNALLLQALSIPSMNIEYDIPYVSFKKYFLDIKLVSST